MEVWVECPRCAYGHNGQAAGGPCAVWVWVCGIVVCSSATRRQTESSGVAPRACVCARVACVRTRVCWCRRRICTFTDLHIRTYIYTYPGGTLRGHPASKNLLRLEAGYPALICHKAWRKNPHPSDLKKYRRDRPDLKICCASRAMFSAAEND